MCIQMNSAMTMQSREPVLQRADRGIYKSATSIVESNPSLRNDDSASQKKAQTHEGCTPPQTKNSSLRNDDSASQTKAQALEGLTPLPTVEALPCIVWNSDSANIQQVPMYYAASNLNHEFSLAELGDVLRRLIMAFRKLSIQAKLRDSPLSAFLQTCENVEFYLVFFLERVDRRRPQNMDPNSRKVYMSVQRHKGDQMVSNQYFHELINAARGIGIEEKNATEQNFYSHRGAPNAEVLMHVEKMIVRACESTVDSPLNTMDEPSKYAAARRTTDGRINSSVEQLYSWIQQPKRLDNRQHALEYLILMTDVKRTMSSSAIAGALLILQGSAPGMNSQAKEIQHFVLTILQHRALPGDRSMFGEMNLPHTDPDKDVVMQPYFPEESEETKGYPYFIVEYLNKLFHLALQVLVQALEVVECFQKQIVADGANIHNMASDFLFVASENGDGKELYLTLLECVDRAEAKHANAYLACKALRLLSLAYTPLKERLQQDDNARLCIRNAFNIGRNCHSLLCDESSQLWETLRKIG
jgi:hypothetical protein